MKEGRNEVMGRQKSRTHVCEVQCRNFHCNLCTEHLWDVDLPRKAWKSLKSALELQECKDAKVGRGIDIYVLRCRMHYLQHCRRCLCRAAILGRSAWTAIATRRENKYFSLKIDILTNMSQRDMCGKEERTCVSASNMNAVAGWLAY